MSQSSMKQQKEILVVGAGVAGLATAKVLAALGHSVRLIEAAPKSQSQGGMSLAMPPNGARALRALGYDLPALLKEGACLNRYELRTFKDKLISAADLHKLWLDEETPYFAIQRKKLFAILSSDLDDSPIQFSHRLKHFELSESKAEKVVTTLEGPEGDEDALFDWVIGADGIQSQVRKLCWPDAKLNDLGQRAWRCIVEWPKDEAAPEAQVLYTGRYLTFLLIPQGASMVYLYAARAEAESEGDPTDGRITRLKEAFSNFSGYVPLALKLMTEQCRDEDIHSSRLTEIELESWQYKDRVLLIGDAAHGCSPSIAQGASQGLEDAWVLGQCVRSHGLSLAAIEEFESRRRPRAMHALAQSRKRDGIVRKKNNSPLFSWIVDQALRIKGLDSVQAEGFRCLLDREP